MAKHFFHDRESKLCQQNGEFRNIQVDLYGVRLKTIITWQELPESQFSREIVKIYRASMEAFVTQKS